MPTNFLKNAVKIFLLSSLIFAGLFHFVEAAKEKPTFIWTNEVFKMSSSGSQTMLNAGTKEIQDANIKIIADAISEKFKTQESVLPFKLQTSMTGDIENLNAQISEENPIQIVPIVVADFVIPQVYTIQGNKYHKYVLVSALDIAFCSEDEDGAYIILSNIPLHFYKQIPETAELSAMTERSREELAREFSIFTAQMIRQNLDFNKYKKLIGRVTDKSFGNVETYRVEDVVYTSKKMQELFGSNKLMQRISGNIFTSDYAAYTENVIYPMILPGENSNWIENAQKSLYSMQITSTHSGEKTITMPKDVDHKIILDVKGVGSQEVQTKQVSDIAGFRMYKLRLLSSIEGKKSIEVSNEMVNEYTKNKSVFNKIELSESDIFGTLLIGASINAAKAQAGKKVK